MLSNYLDSNDKPPIASTQIPPREKISQTM